MPFPKNVNSQKSYKQNKNDFGYLSYKLERIIPIEHNKNRKKLLIVTSFGRVCFYYHRHNDSFMQLTKTNEFQNEI